MAKHCQFKFDILDIKKDKNVDICTLSQSDEPVGFQFLKKIEFGKLNVYIY